jgi:glycerophosphoryl diester phosphodiesterase
MSQVHVSQSPRRNSRAFLLRKILRFCIRVFQTVVLVTLTLLLYVFMCVEFPNELIIYGQTHDTSILSWLQGHDQYNDETSHSPEVIGHRGKGLKSTDDSVLSVGNTTKAIRAAAEAHVDWIEIDVRMTKDNHLVLFHDRKLSPKVANLDTGEETKSIGDLTWNRVRQLELKICSDDRQIPTLTQGLEAANEVEGYDPQWVLDIKLEKGPERREAMKQQLLAALPSTSILSPSKVTILGNQETLHFLYREGESRLSREYRCGMIVGLTEKNALTFLLNPAKWVTEGQQIGADILVLPLVFVTESIIKEAKSAGMKVWVWNCNQVADQNRLKHYKVEGLILDDFPE